MPYDPKTLRALAHRLEGGEVGRGLSDAVWRALGWTELQSVGSWMAPDGRTVEYFQRPDLTTSIDAQAKLGATVFQMTWMEPFEHIKESWTALAVVPGTQRTAKAKAPAEPAARLGAILRALAEATP